MSEDRRFYVVIGRAKHGTITHKCPTAEFALDSLHRFSREKMDDIRIFDPDGLSLAPAELEALLKGQATPTPRALVESP